MDVCGLWYAAAHLFLFISLVVNISCMYVVYVRPTYVDIYHLLSFSPSRAQPKVVEVASVFTHCRSNMKSCAVGKCQNCTKERVGLQ